MENCSRTGSRRDKYTIYSRILLFEIQDIDTQMIFEEIRNKYLGRYDARKIATFAESSREIRQKEV